MIANAKPKQAQNAIQAKWMRFNIQLLVSFLLISIAAAQAQLVATVSQPKISGQKAVVELTMENHFGEGIKSARAICFVLDDRGELVGQSTKWVIGQNKVGLEPGATNTFNFVITSPQPLVSTNLTTKVSFSRVVLASGQVADVNKTVKIK